jgi:membrane protease YdiL (CAAX protease family)
MPTSAPGREAGFVAFDRHGPAIRAMVTTQGNDTLTPFIPKRFEQIAFGFLLSCMMSFMVSGFSILISFGPEPGFFLHWMRAWLPSWAVAFPVVLVVAPFVRRVIARIVIQP